MYVQKVKKKVIILSLNMNDILLTGNDLELIIATQKWLSFAFKMKDIGDAYYILGVKIQKDRSKRLLSLSQKTYIKRILKHFCMYNSKSIDTPIIKSHILSVEQYHKIEEEKKLMINVPYSSAIGSLLYAIMCTWFDICFVVGMVNKYQSNPGISH